MFFCPFYLFRFPVKGEYVDIHFVTSYHGFLPSFWFGWLSLYSGVIFFFTSAPSYDGVMYAINLKCLKSVLFWIINLGKVPGELLKTKKVVSSINISKWSAGPFHVKLKVFSSAESSSVLWDRFCEGWCNGGLHWPSSWQILSPLCERSIQSK